MTTTTKFEAGRTYWTRSICDYDCIHRVTIVRRTAKSVWIAERDGSESRRAISVWDGVEHIYPFGKYSMCAIIGADRAEAADDQADEAAAVEAPAPAPAAFTLPRRVNTDAETILKCKIIAADETRFTTRH